MDIWIPQYEIDDLLGKEKARILCAQYGGVKLYLPKNTADDSGLATLLGKEAYTVFTNKFAGCRVVLPNGRQPDPIKKEIIKALQNGETPREIALKYCVTERWVYRVKQLEKEESRQLSLF